MYRRKLCSTGCGKFAHYSGLCMKHGGVGPGCSNKRTLCSTGCGKQARSHGLCKKHGGGRRCIDLGCGKSAQGKTEFCNEHGGGSCNYPKCGKSAQGKTEFCKKHGGGKRCTSIEPLCKNSAVGNSGFCTAHGGGRPCIFFDPKCGNSARHNSDFCLKHGGGKRCDHPGCGTSAEGKTNLCVKHGGGRRCLNPKCDKSAQGKTDLCVKHGGGTRCALCTQHCVKYEGDLCWKCRTGTERIKQYEYMVKEYLLERGLFFSYEDRPLPCSANLRRGDFVYILSDRIIILEVDEHAHRYYNRDCELVRVTELMEQCQATPLILIRFNPQKSLLEKMAQVIQESIHQDACALLDVKFIGYKEKYDVIQGIEELAIDRRTGA